MQIKIINKVIYSFNRNIISCSDDKNNKILKLNINEYQFMKNLNLNIQNILNQCYY
jgi:hypothetical protein